MAHIMIVLILYINLLNLLWKNVYFEEYEAFKQICSRWQSIFFFFLFVYYFFYFFFFSENIRLPISCKSLACSLVHHQYYLIITLALILTEEK